ncbi:MAG: sugar phosphate isomerase/epimerase family protein [Verrucomicrobiota bacterium]
MKRRDFLQAAAGLAMAGGVSAATSTNAPATNSAAATSKPKYVPPVLRAPLVGSQLYGWGQYYQRAGRSLEAHLDEALSALRDAGYDYAEGNLDVGTPDNNGRFAERLRKKGLKPVSLYTGGATHILGKATETVERIARAAKEAGRAGFGIINFNPDPVGRPKTVAELEIQAEALRELGQELKGLGIRLGIHHHTPELADGAREFHANFEKCPADTVGFCYDVHWVYRGGIAPADCLRQYGSRIVSWHLRQSRGQVWWEDLDAGDLDYPMMARVARQLGIPAFYTVELALEGGTQVTRDAVANHARSREYVRRVFGV